MTSFYYLKYPIHHSPPSPSPPPRFFVRLQFCPHFRESYVNFRNKFIIIPHAFLLGDPASLIIKKKKKPNAMTDSV